jgi:lysyl-tRNA synthetase, class I
MSWLDQIVEELIARHPDGEILVESGASPSGTYHVGHLREVATPDAVFSELKRRGRKVRHVHFVDDMDALRKIPVNIPADYEQYLGMPLCDIPAPDGSDRSYAEYFLADLKDVCETLGIDVEFQYSHEKYRSGFMALAIERSLDRLAEARNALETVSGRKLDEKWTPIQILENGRLAKRQFVSIDKVAKTIKYLNANGEEKDAKYDAGEVALDWRLDWPGRWWLLDVMAEGFGRDHATKGGSYDTGVQIMRDVFGGEAPYPMPYDFINMAGDTKKKSASKGTGLDALGASRLMPAEVLLYFILRSAPSKRLYIDPVADVIKLTDEFAALCAKTDKTPDEEQLVAICTHGGTERRSVSRVPFSHLVASYQASLKDPAKTLEVISRTEHSQAAAEEAEIIKAELKFIDAWLQKRAPEDIKFELAETVDAADFTDIEKRFLNGLADKIETAPADADGAWFHTAIYEFKESLGLSPKDMFVTLYRALIGKTSGPRAGWFLSILPRDWLVDRLRLNK